MKRVHTIEFEDFGWFPPWIRAHMTDLLTVLARRIGVTSVLSQLVAQALQQLGDARLVDLGSGSGGVMPNILDELRRQPGLEDVELTLSDLHPNPEAAERLAAAGIHYAPEPVRASDLANAPPGLKTMVNCFHHLRPVEAREVLVSAQVSRQPLLVYEMADNEVPLLLWAALLPLTVPAVALSAWLLTPFVRPLTLRRLLFTYAVPLVPFFYAWDGQASLPRIYTLGDLGELLEGLEESVDYRWQRGVAKDARGKKLGIYLLGLPA